VNLYGDEALCASESYTMVADTFAISQDNQNCSYLWSTSPTDTLGELTVTESGEYSVTVTSLCGETAEDSKTLEFYPLPPADAGRDTSLCFGDTIQLNASGGVLFDWSPSGTLTDPGMQNPRAFPATTTMYYVSVTDTNGCSNVDNMTLTVHPIPASTFSAPVFVCGTNAASLSYTGGAGMDATYFWDFDGGTDSPSGETHNVSWSELGLKTVSLVVEDNACLSDTTRKDISVNPVPISEFSMPAAVCSSDEAAITYDGTDSLGADYSWSFDGGTVVSGADEGPYQVSWATEGTKTVSLQVTQEGCVSLQTIKQIVASYPYEGSEICLVTVDTATGKNLVIWEKAEDEGIASYNIYREGTQTGIYNLLDNVPFDSLSVYTDVTSSPRNKQHLYKIAAVDTCGNESSWSPYHKTLLLQYVSAEGGVNMSWAEYEIEGGEINFVSYDIYRGSDSTSLEKIETISASSDVYTDTDPEALAGQRWYRIAGIKPVACYPTVKVDGKKAGTGPYAHSLSNLDDNKLRTSVDDLMAGANNLRIYPNPFRDKLRVEYLIRQASDVRIEVYNILGIRVLEVENSRQLPGVYNYDIRAEDLDGSSLYYMKFSIDNKTSVRKLVPAR